MSMTERQKALIRIGTAYVNGETPDPLDVDIAKRSSAGGRPKGSDRKHFIMMLNMAFSYFHARKYMKLSCDDAFAYAVNLSDTPNVSQDSLKAYCSYLRSEEFPADQWMKDYLIQTRIALKQSEAGTKV